MSQDKYLPGVPQKILAKYIWNFVASTEDCSMIWLFAKIYWQNYQAACNLTMLEKNSQNDDVRQLKRFLAAIFSGVFQPNGTSFFSSIKIALFVQIIIIA